MKNQIKFILAAATLALAACGSQQGETTNKANLNAADFDTTINNKPVKLYTLQNKNGMEVDVTNFGARIVAIMVPDKAGTYQDVVLGYDNIKQYADREHTPSDFGAAIGRYANRIFHGQLTLDGKKIQLPINDHGHCLHGGPTGWQYQVYQAVQPNDSTIKLTIDSPDGDNNFPGNVKASVTYTLTSDNSIDIKYEATTDKETVINMTNHSYFNLNGDPQKISEDNVLYINADNYTPSDSSYMTTGEIVPVKGTPMDFTKPTALNKNINNQNFVMTRNAMGYDHNWVLNTYKDGKGDISQVAASLYSPETGIFLQIYTNEPGIQIYTGNFLDGKTVCKHGKTYPKHASVCLETQHFPDSPNKPQWPSTILKPGQKYESHTIFHFSVK